MTLKEYITKTEDVKSGLSFITDVLYLYVKVKCEIIPFTTSSREYFLFSVQNESQQSLLRGPMLIKGATRKKLNKDLFFFKPAKLRLFSFSFSFHLPKQITMRYLYFLRWFSFIHNIEWKCCELFRFQMPRIVSTEFFIPICAAEEILLASLPRSRRERTCNKSSALHNSSLSFQITVVSDQRSLPQTRAISDPTKHFLHVKFAAVLAHSTRRTV